MKQTHEIRDPIHVFVRLNSQERPVLDCRPFQRLRHIHQLAMSSLVYPSATHKRFEHSLGVMELSGRVFGVVTNEEWVTDQIRELLPEILNRDEKAYWRRVVRMAALCHDTGHLPFSHAAEKDLLPEGHSHEDLTRALIVSEEMVKIWERMTPPLRQKDIAKLAIGPKKAQDLQFTDGEAILSEIIVGDAFGVDRIDYLLRDPYHAGVAYGRFDHHRLIDTLRILPTSPSAGDQQPTEPTLGIEDGGIQSAEALALARYFMYSQVYFHQVRRAYDLHLKDCLKCWLPNGQYLLDLEEHLKVTDNEVWAGLSNASRDAKANGHIHAERIVNRNHLRMLYSRNPDDLQVNNKSGDAIYRDACSEYSEESVIYDLYTPGADGLAQRSWSLDPMCRKGA